MIYLITKKIVGRLKIQLQDEKKVTAQQRKELSDCYKQIDLLQRMLGENKR